MRAIGWQADCDTSELPDCDRFFGALVTVLADGTTLSTADIERMILEPGWGP